VIKNKKIIENGVLLLIRNFILEKIIIYNIIKKIVCQLYGHQKREFKKEINDYLLIWSE
jgi:hypothetical protein